MTELFLVFIAACLTNNLVLDYLIGVSPVFAISRKIEAALGISLAMLVILPVTSLLTYAFDTYVLRPFDLNFLQLLIFVIVLTTTTLLIEKTLEKFQPNLHEKVAMFVPLLLVNTVLLGVASINVMQNYGIFTSLIFGMGSAAGFGVVIITFSALRDRITVADVPRAFQGSSILLITLGILSMAFMGFTGVS